MSRQIHQTPGEVEAEGGLVIVDGLSAVMASFTPAAAAEIGQQMIDAAARASKQQPPRDAQFKA